MAICDCVASSHGTWACLDFRKQKSEFNKANKNVMPWPWRTKGLIHHIPAVCHSHNLVVYITDKHMSKSADGGSYCLTNMNHDVGIKL